MRSSAKGIRTGEEYQLHRIVGKGHSLHTLSSVVVVGGGTSSFGVGSLTFPSDRFAGRTAEAFTNIASTSGMMKVMYNGFFDDKRIFVERSPLAS